MSKNKYLRTKLACYSSNITMAIVTNLSPLLFITFRELYGLSYSLLGSLIVINFVSQLSIDVIFSLFSHRFNIPKVVKLMPLFSFLGLVLYGLAPFIFPNNIYAGLALGTLVFSTGSGLGEVLISPIIGAIPAENPDREMSKLHSIYAWGSVFSVLLTTLLIYILSDSLWPVIPFIYALLPLVSLFMYAVADIPEMETPKRLSGALGMLGKSGVWLCIGSIFFGSVAENIMSQWSSGYLERGLGMSKLEGDILGVAGFALTLGIARTLYAKYGKKIERILLLGGIGAVTAFALCIISNNPIIGVLSCALAGLSTSMLWPGSLIVAAERYPESGVFIYAIMAAGGDLGASVGPQIVGLVTDDVMLSDAFKGIANTLCLTSEQLGMKAGLLAGMIFPLIGIIIYSRLLKDKNQKQREEQK